MGAGKTTIARTLGLPVVETDASVPIELFAQGEHVFRAREEQVVREMLERNDPVVVDLGGGAVTSERTRALLRERATVVWIDADVDTCWERVAGSDRPLAQNRADFERLYSERRVLYEEVADVRARDADDVALAAAGIVVANGALQKLGDYVDGPVALVSDPNVAGIHGMDAQLALGQRLQEMHELPAGEEAKTLAALDRLWQDLRLDRTGTLVALGGGCTTDAAGFAAATYLRGIDWVPVPTSLVGQVDAAIGGKTAIDLPQGKNLVGAFHWPARTVIDPLLLDTLPEKERREGMSEVVKTSLLAGENLHDPLDVRRCAAFKAAICLRDPHDHGERKRLNLGHTFAHALETAAQYEGVTHGQAVALGLKAALKLSGEDTRLVDELLQPKPVRVDRDAAWAAMRRDKKTVGGELRLVLLREWDVPVPEHDVRAALDELIAG
ncbi:MAG TPA: bifunctional shikimate kinase/3-dehydroquinate synthase [Gaiellaceae bacterium]